jgi:hypothetical protein
VNLFTVHLSFAKFEKAYIFLLFSGFLSEKSHVIKIGICGRTWDSFMGLEKVFSDVGIHFLASQSAEVLSP